MSQKLFLLILASFLILQGVYAQTSEVSASGFASAEEEIASIKWETYGAELENTGNPDAKKGGTITFSFTSPPATLRYYGPDSKSQVVSTMTGACYEPLCGFSALTLRYAPGLAESWGSSPDGSTFYFKLDPRAKWADGKPVTSDDVVMTYDFQTSPLIKDPFYNAMVKDKYFRPVALTDRIVKVKVKNKNWRSFMDFATSTLIWPAHKIRELKIYPEDEKNPEKLDYISEYQFKMMLGSGPYEFDESKFVKDEEYWLKRRPDYWGYQLPGIQNTYNFDYWKMIIIRDENLQFEKFKKGELDFFIVLMSKQWVRECDFDKIQNGWIQKVKVSTDYARGISGFAFNMRREPFNDVRVRQAFSYLINIEELVHMLMYDEYLKLDSYFPSTDYEAKDAMRFRYDPDKAVELLKEAGWTEWDDEGRICKKDKYGGLVPLSFELPYRDKSWERILTVVQEYLEDVGITMKMKLYTPETHWVKIMERKYDMSYQSWTGLQFPNPRGSWHSEMADKNNTTNICGVSDPEVDRLIQEYEESFDYETRAGLMRQLDKKLIEIQPYCLSYYGPHTRLLYWDKFDMPKGVLAKQMSNAVWPGILSLWSYNEEKDKNLQTAISAGTKIPMRNPVDVFFWKHWNEYLEPIKEKNGGKFPSGEEISRLYNEFYKNYDSKKYEKK